MARFAGEVGYGEQVKTAPGVWEDLITEHRYFGDVIRVTMTQRDGDEKVNTDLAVNNAISVVADERAVKHFSKIKYVRWEGVLWVVTSVELKHPRLILNIGEVYNGPTPAAPDPA